MINIDDNSPNMKDEFEFPGEDCDLMRRNDPKYKMDLKILRTMLNNFYQERGYEKVILPSF